MRKFNAGSVEIQSLTTVWSRSFGQLQALCGSLQPSPEPALSDIRIAVHSISDLFPCTAVPCVPEHLLDIIEAPASEERTQLCQVHLLVVPAS